MYATHQEPSETDFRDDQIVPIDAAGKPSREIVKHASLLVYPAGPHGLSAPHKMRANADMPALAWA